MQICHKPFSHLVRVGLFHVAIECTPQLFSGHNTFSTELSSSHGIFYERILLFLVINSLKIYFRDLSALFYLKMAVQGGLITPESGSA